MFETRETRERVATRSLTPVVVAVYAIRIFFALCSRRFHRFCLLAEARAVFQHRPIF